MARLESVAVGGYYATPEHLLPLIASHMSLSADARSGRSGALFDPCAGEGHALVTLYELLHEASQNHLDARLEAIELEKTRYEALRQHVYSAHHGDAFRAVAKGMGALYLNPPYDFDQKHKRLEERFLERFSQSLIPHGVLVFVVPYYALKASAKTLATRFEDIQCFRFPDEDFQVFKQVVLFAKRLEHDYIESLEDLEAPILKWASDPDSIPVLTTGEAHYRVPPAGSFYSSIEMKSLDVKTILEELQPWTFTARGGKLQPIPVVPDQVLSSDLLLRTYPIAMPPRSAHIAAGIAAGVFNGSRISPDDPKSKLPDLLVKGVFDREFRTVEEKTDKKGVTTGVVQVQQPKLVTTILDLDSGEYTTIKPSPDLTHAKKVADMTMADLLANYGEGLMKVMLDHCPVLHDPSKDETDLLPVKRPLFEAQTHAAHTVVQLLGGRQATRRQRRFKGAFVLGEIGSGKCLGIGTKVLKFDGTLINVEDVQMGDLLMGPDSRPRRVLGTTRGEGELFRVVPKVGSPWVCNDAHILTLVHTISDDVFDIPIQEYASNKRLSRSLTNGGRRSHPVTEFKQFFPENGVDFPDRLDPEVDPYFLGVWYGDGSKRAVSKGLACVSVTTADQVIVDLLHQTASDWGLRVNKYGGSEGSLDRCPTYHLSSGQSQKNPNDLLTAMRRLYVGEDSLPDCVKLGSRAVRAAFLAGFLDADGHLSQGCFDFIQKRRGWSEDVCFIARSLGIRAELSKGIKQAQTGQSNTYWRVSLSGDFTTLPTRIPRKQAVPRATLRLNKKSGPSKRRTRKVNRTGIRVEPLGIGPYAGFELDGDGRFLLGDFTVTHNTSVALSVAHTIQTKRTLVMCPPHLLDSWTEQIQAVTPWMRVKVLSDITDVTDLAQDSSDEPTIAILSRETAKLGPGVEGLQRGARCPECGAHVPSGDHAKKRSRCEHQALTPKNKLGDLALKLALTLAPYYPSSGWVKLLCTQKTMQRFLMRQIARMEDKAFDAGTPDLKRILEPVLDQLLALREDPALIGLNVPQMIGTALAACPDPELILKVVNQLNLEDYREKDLAFDALLFSDHPSLFRQALKFKQVEEETVSRWNRRWDKWEATRDAIWGRSGEDSRYIPRFRRKDDVLEWEPNYGTSFGISSPEVVLTLLQVLAGDNLRKGPECGSPLFQMASTPRRYPVATFIARRHPRLFDLLILDEGHEYSNGDSAQAHAAHRLTALGTPTVIMTGTVMNGYAESLFHNTWSISNDFREEFARDDVMRFVNRYGYRKRFVEDKDSKTKKPVAFGTMSDRVERSERMIGKAPGVLPLFLFQHLLPLSVTLHKADLSANIPNCEEHVIPIQPLPTQESEYKRLQTCLVEQIRRDRFEEGLAGKLWGAMAHFPSYLDLCTADTGNQDGEFVIAYPDSVGGAVIAKSQQLSETTILPKEEWMINHVKRAMAEDRNVMIFAWHSNLLPRLAKLIETHVGVDCPILDPAKVSTKKRQAWINREIVKKKRRVMVVNPVAIQTGLNNLVYFSDEVWMENPACNPIIYRQAVGRVDRVGQLESTRIYFPVYTPTAQVALHKLLLHKVGVSMSTDGLDAESALQAAGIGEDTEFSSFAVGRQLYEMITQRAA